MKTSKSFSKCFCFKRFTDIADPSGSPYIAGYELNPCYDFTDGDGEENSCKSVSVSI